MTKDKTKLEKLKDLGLLGSIKVHCHITGCKNLETACVDCGRLINTAEGVGGWMDVEHSLPNHRKTILMTYNNLVMTGCFANGKFYQDEGCAHTPGYCICDEQEGITHWMPLPLPPKVELDS